MVRPYELLHSELGVQANVHAGAEYEFTKQHLDALAALEVPAIALPERYLLMVETGDEVLDYRSAVERYRGCRQPVGEDGDHSFSTFALRLDTVIAFCDTPTPAEQERRNHTEDEDRDKIKSRKGIGCGIGSRPSERARATGY
jgi:predicted esterase YcpF (UPF0227 family)